jgi:DNA adenine methylase
MTRKLNALVPYFGCKRQLADRIIAEFGDHYAFWDIMCGSCAIPLAKENVRQTVINDLHGPVVNLARVVADDFMSERLFSRLYRTEFCDELYRDSVHWLTNIYNAERFQLDWAYHYFVVGWQGRNGLVGTVKELDTGFCRRFTANGGDPATRFRNVVENIPVWWEKMRGWTILSEDAIFLCSKIEDKEGVVIYADPPYISKDADYAHDFNRKDDDFVVHRKLSQSLRRFKRSLVCVSYYVHPLLEELYPRNEWQHTTISVPKNLSVLSGATTAPEVLLTNRAA